MGYFVRHYVKVDKPEVPGCLAGSVEGYDPRLEEVRAGIARFVKGFRIQNSGDKIPIILGRSPHTKYPACCGTMGVIPKVFILNSRLIPRPLRIS